MATTEARAESPTCASDNSTRSSGKRSCVSGAMHHFAAALQEEASLHTRNDKGEKGECKKMYGVGSNTGGEVLRR